MLQRFFCPNFHLKSKNIVPDFSLLRVDDEDRIAVARLNEVVLNDDVIGAGHVNVLVPQVSEVVTNDLLKIKVV